MTKANTRVYGIEEMNNYHKIRATSQAEAKRIYKKLFGGLIKNMTVIVICGYAFKADND